MVFCSLLSLVIVSTVLLYGINWVHASFLWKKSFWTAPSQVWFGCGFSLILLDFHVNRCWILNSLKAFFMNLNIFPSVLSGLHFFFFWKDCWASLSIIYCLDWFLVSSFFISFQIGAWFYCLLLYCNMSLELRAYCFFVFSSLVEVYGCGFLLLHFACAGKPSQTLVHGRYHLTLYLIPVNFIALSKCFFLSFLLQQFTFSSFVFLWVGIRLILLAFFCLLWYLVDVFNSLLCCTGLSCLFRILKCLGHSSLLLLNIWYIFASAYLFLCFLFMLWIFQTPLALFKDLQSSWT